MTEPGAGSDLQGVKTRANKTGNQYTINGSKTFITNGQNANLMIVVAKTDPTKGAKGTSLIVVETDEVEGLSAAATSTRLASRPTIRRSCSSTTSRFLRRTCLERKRARVSSS
jgi:alkylation response protein AidB-like acyl-CoA dehydrogenase